VWKESELAVEKQVGIVLDKIVDGMQEAYQLLCTLNTVD
jgi:hypothetical protein